MNPRNRPLLITAVLMIGLSLIAAPAVFHIFSRTPLGGMMIDDFDPFMTEQQVSLFRGYLDEVGAGLIQEA